MKDGLVEIAQQILEVVNKSTNVLLHCHPGPDPDSVGAVLACGMVLEGIGKKVTIISGDSPVPNALARLPNFGKIVNKNYTQIVPSDYDLFLILDSSSKKQITRFLDISFPETMKTVVIDHHASNSGFADINLISPVHPSTCQILFDLFNLWGTMINADISLCLFMGIYADTGGFKYQSTSAETFRVAFELTSIFKDYHPYIFDLENNRQPAEIAMMGLAFSSIEQYLDGKLVFSSISYSKIKKRGFSKDEAMEGLVGDYLRSVVGWEIVASLVEAEENVVTVSLRTRDESRYDVSRIVKLIGENGGGHAGAAGTVIHLSLKDAKIALKETIAKLYFKT